MADENTGVKEGQVADDQGVTQVATGEGVTGAKQASTDLADGTKQDDHMIPKTRFDEVNDAKKAAEEALLLTEQKLAQSVQIQQQTAYNQQVAQAAPQPNSTFELAMQQCGLTPEDLYDGNNIVKVQNRKAELDLALQQQQTALATNQQFMASHPDFQQVVGSVNPATGQITAWSQEALLLQQKKQYSFQSAQSAYEAVMSERKLVKLEKAATANEEHLARQGVDTQTQPLGGSAAGGGGAGDRNQEKLMTREQVLEIERGLENE